MVVDSLAATRFLSQNDVAAFRMANTQLQRTISLYCISFCISVASNVMPRLKVVSHIEIGKIINFIKVNYI